MYFNQSLKVTYKRKNDTVNTEIEISKEYLNRFYVHLETSQKESDAMLYRLAQQITYREELRVLVLKGLGGSYHRLEANLCNHPGDVKEAAYQTLKEWFRFQPCKKQAYRSLCSALEQANMPLLIEALND